MTREIDPADIQRLLDERSPRTIPEMARLLDTGWDRVNATLRELEAQALVVQQDWSELAFALFWAPDAV